MKNIKLILLALTMVTFYHQVSAEASADTAKTNAAAVAKIKTQIVSMIADSDVEFLYNQGPSASPVPIFEDQDNKTKYFLSRTQFQGEVSLVREEERNTAVYKTLVIGWVLNNTTPRAAREEANNARRAAKELIKEKVASGRFRSFNVKSTDSSARTEVRDSVGNRIFEIAEHQTYFHLIIYGKKWRTDPVDGLLSDFTINKILNNKNYRKPIISEYPFTIIGTKNQVTLYAAPLGNEVIFAVDNYGANPVKVKIKLEFECIANKLNNSYKEEVNHTISTAANSQMVYDKSLTTLRIEGCKKQANRWQILTWSVE